MDLFSSILKKTAVMILAAAVAVSGTGCGSSESSSGNASLARVSNTKKTDIKSLAQKLVSDCSYDTKLKSVDDSVSSTMITLCKGSRIAMYLGKNGEKADTVIVVESSNQDNARKDEKSVDEYLDDMQKSFQGYLPKEEKKMEDDRVVVRKGDYIAACVTKDSDKARDIIDDTL